MVVFRHLNLYTRHDQRRLLAVPTWVLSSLDEWCTYNVHLLLRARQTRHALLVLLCCDFGVSAACGAGSSGFASSGIALVMSVGKVGDWYAKVQGKVRAGMPSGRVGKSHFQGKNDRPGGTRPANSRAALA